MEAINEYKKKGLDDDQFINSDSLHKLQSIEADIVGTEAWSMDNNGYAKRI